MAKGSIAKEKLFSCLLKAFDGAFMEDAKTLRIPVMENGETVELKVALTAAKENIGGSAQKPVRDIMDTAPVSLDKEVEPTKEELERLAEIIRKFNL